MKIVTGGAGFIGSNIVKQLNNRGIDDIIIVDDLTDGRKCRNLQGLDFFDYMDYADFDEQMADDTFDCGYIDVVFHEGACSDTMNYDGRYMMKNNYEGSKNLLRYCMSRKIPFLYASSASTYGSGRNGFREDPSCEEASIPMRIPSSSSTVSFAAFSLSPRAKSSVSVISTSSDRRKTTRTRWHPWYSRNTMNSKKQGKLPSLKGRQATKTAVRSATSST